MFKNHRNFSVSARHSTSGSNTITQMIRLYEVSTATLQALYPRSASPIMQIASARTNGNQSSMNISDTAHIGAKSRSISHKMGKES